MDEDLKEELKNKIKLYLEKGTTRKDIVKKLNITYYTFDKLKKELKENNELDLKKMTKIANPKSSNQKNINDICFSSPETRARYEAIDIISRKYLGYETGQQNFNSFLSRKIEAMSYSYSYNVILATIKKCENNLTYAVQHKTFESDAHKISYLCAIINNNLKRTLDEKEKKQRINKGLEKREKDYGEINQNIVTSPTKRMDFSIFLDEDDD